MKLFGDKSTSDKKKVCELGFIKIKNLYSKGLHEESEPTEGEKIFVSYISYKGLVSRMCKKQTN